MSEEKAGQPGQETAPAQKTEQPPQTLASGKFAGKSAEEVAAAYEELERKLGAQGQELGQLKSMNEQMTTYLQQLAQQTQKPPEPTEKPANWDWDRPIESVSQLAGQVAGKEVDKKLGEFYRVIRTQQAMTASGFAKMVAKQQYPLLFDADTEKEVDSFMQGALKSGQVDPAVVENPQMWTNVAWVVKGAKQNFNPSGIVSPVSPQYGETPAGAKGREIEEEGGEPLDLQPEHIAAIKEAGLEVEAITKEIRQDRKKGRK